MLFKVFTADYPFPWTKMEKALRWMQKKKLVIPAPYKDTISPEFRDFFVAIFEPNPKKRPVLEDLRRHQWIQEEYDRLEHSIQMGSSSVSQEN
jgi:hypothetical protein